MLEQDYAVTRRLTHYLSKLDRGPNSGKREIPFKASFMVQVPKHDSVTFLIRSTLWPKISERDGVTFLKRSTLWPRAASENFEVNCVVICYKSVLAPVALSFGSVGLCINIFNALCFR